MTPSADRSAAILTQHIRNQEPFFFVRYGDGALECMDPQRRPKHTCDHELYTPELAKDLMAAWVDLELACEHVGMRVYAGDWQSASFGNGSGSERDKGAWEGLTEACSFVWLHFETLLLMRDSQALVDFYRAVKNDPRRKVYMGPLGNAPAAKTLGATHLVTPMVPDLHRNLHHAEQWLEANDFDVLLYGAGLAGNVVAVKSWIEHPERTYISLGSAMDPLFRGRSRSQQLPQARLREMFKELL